MKSKWIFASLGFKKSKILRVMKLFPIFMFLLVFGATAKSFSQEQLVSLNLHQCDVSMLFKEICKQIDIRFVYNEEHVKQLGRFDVKVSGESVQEILQKLFKSTNLECRFESDVIFITPRSKASLPVDSLKNEVLRGKVTDEKGGGLPGVTVIMKGTTTGTATDPDGRLH